MIGVALLVLARLERNVALLAFTLGYLALVLLVLRAQLGVAQVGEAGERGPRHVAVADQVVAGDDRERRDAPRPPQVQGLDDEAEGGARRAVAGGVLEHRGVGGREAAGRVVDLIAALGDGQRDDPRGGVGELLDHRERVVGREDIHLYAQIGKMAAEL